MAPFKSHLAFFLAIALVATAMPQPSAAARAEPPASSTTGVQPSNWHNLRALPSCLWPIIAPIFGPPTPSAPPPPSKPQPKEFLPWLMGLMPCKDFITNKTSTPPPFPGKCCDGLNSLFKDAPVCMCHFENGELDKLMSAPIAGDNLFGLGFICHSDGPSDYESCDGPVPPVKAAPTPEAAP